MPRWRHKITLRPLGEPEDLASAFLFLPADGASLYHRRIHPRVRSGQELKKTPAVKKGRTVRRRFSLFFPTVPGALPPAPAAVGKGHHRPILGGSEEIFRTAGWGGGGPAQAAPPAAGTLSLGRWPASPGAHDAPGPTAGFCGFRFLQTGRDGPSGPLTAPGALRPGRTLARCFLGEASRISMGQGWFSTTGTFLPVTFSKMSLEIGQLVKSCRSLDGYALRPARPVRPCGGRKVSGTLGRLVVDHRRQLVLTSMPGRRFRGHQHPDRPALEAVQGPDAGGLGPCCRG